MPLSTEVGDYLDRQEGQGYTCVMLAAGGQLTAVFAIADPIKPEAQGVLAALHEMGIEVSYPYSVMPSCISPGPSQFAAYVAMPGSQIVGIASRSGLQQELGVHHFLSCCHPSCRL